MAPLRDADPGNNDLKHFTSLTLRWIGDVLKSQGKLGDALTAYREALALAEAVAKADPGNTDGSRDVGQSHERIGDVLLAQGNLPGALASYQEDRSVLYRLAVGRSE